MSELELNSPDACTTHASMRRGERSFSLLETIIAVSLIAILMVEVSGVYGNSIAFNDYGRKVLQASYLAKRLMSQVEYQAATRTPIKDLKSASVKEVVFDDAPDFTYSISVEPLPNALELMLKIFSGGMMGGDKDDDDKDNSGAGAMLGQMKGLIEQSVGEEPIWIARVEVSWPEGARRNNTKLAMIITDTKKLEDSVGTIMDSASVPTSAGGAVPSGTVPGTTGVTPAPVNPTPPPGGP